MRLQGILQVPAAECESILAGVVKTLVVPDSLGVSAGRYLLADDQVRGEVWLDAPAPPVPARSSASLGVDARKRRQLYPRARALVALPVLDAARVAMGDVFVPSTELFYLHADLEVATVEDTTVRAVDALLEKVTALEPVLDAVWTGDAARVRQCVAALAEACLPLRKLVPGDSEGPAIKDPIDIVRASGLLDTADEGLLADLERWFKVAGAGIEAIEDGEVLRGMVVSPPWMAQAMVDGDKTLFVKPRDQDLTGRWAVISERRALGIVELAAAGTVDRAGLLQRVDQTGIDATTLDEWARTYPSWGGDQFWLWRVAVRERFAEPRSTDAPIGPQGAIPAVEVADAVGKMHVVDVNPASLRRVDDTEIRTMNLRLHQLFGSLFADNDRMSAGDLRREVLVNAYLFLRDEMHRRGFAVGGDSPLDRAADQLVQRRAQPHALVRPGRDGADLTPVSLAEVLPHFQSFTLRMPFLYMVGGLPNRGTTNNDIDLVVRGPVDAAMLHVLKFRLGRMLPPEISARLQVHGDELGGPFTNHIELADLVVQFRPSFDIKQMVLKADDPNLDLPSSAGPRDAVLQYHFRGASVHGDLRLKVGDYLVGWTLALARPGVVPDVKGDMERAKAIAAAFDVRGGRYNKPIEAPARIYAVPKERQPLPWLRYERAFPPGEVGASAEESGVMVIVDTPKVQWGLQSPRFHEYFLTSGKDLAGILTLRQLVSEGGGAATPRGEPFWTAQLSRVALPSVLRSHAVEVGTMPEDGRSALPLSLERITPREFRYWEARGAKARELRDALVASKFFTEQNVAVVDGEFVRIEQKAYVYVGDGSDVRLAAPRRFVLAWQTWRGQQVERFGPTREVFHLLIEEDGRVRDFILQTDPLSGESGITATTREVGAELLDLKGDLEPGRAYGGVVLNDTKATPSRWDVVDSGTASATQTGGGAWQLDLRGRRLRGRFEVVPEGGSGGDTGLWTFAPVDKDDAPETLRRVIPTRDGMQIWDPDRKDPDVDRTALRPLAIFQPMKPRDRKPDVDAVLATMVTPAALKGGVYVEPKWNGFRFVFERQGDRLIGYTEDHKVDILPNLPGLEAELRQIPGDWVLDAEFMAVDDQGRVVPRADLAAYRGASAIEDADVRLHVFDVLYWGGHNLTATQYDQRREVLERDVFGGKDRRGDHLLLSPTRLVHTEAALRDAYAWASRQEGSEGAMFKLLPSTYTLGGITDSWQKVREVRQILALVYDRQPVKDNPNAWVLLGAVGPIPADAVGKWRETIEWKGKRYVALGHTFSSALDAPPGAIISVAATELFYNPTEGVLHWFQPSVTGRARQTFPMTVDQVIALVQPEEVREEVGVGKALAFLSTASERTVALVKSAEERMVYGIVLEPETVDAQGDIYDAATIRQAAHIFMEKFGGLGLMHRYIINGQARILETWIAPCDLDLNGTAVKKGTWLLAVRVLDDELWNAVKAGHFTGFSIGGSARRIAARADN